MGPRHFTLMFYGVLGALLLAPFWWASSGRGVALFSIICFSTGFAVMSLVRASGYVHHVVLLWPLPQLLVGIAVTSIRRRGVAVTVAAVLVCANLLVDSQWMADLERGGSYGLFTDAIYPLAETLAAHAAQKICLTDFGMSDNVNMLTQGRLDLRDCWGALIAPAEVQDREVPNVIADPNVLFVGHVPGLEIQVGVADRLHSLARKEGRHKRVFQVVQDANRRPVFELFRFE